MLLGDRELYYLLSQHDPEFLRLFKVQADFDDTIDRRKENDAAYARLIAAIVATHKLKPVDADGVARLIEEGARMAEERERLTIEIGRIADIVREADYWSDAGKEKVTGREDIARAIEEQIAAREPPARPRRSRRSSAASCSSIPTGQKVGQINGLSLIDPGDFAFGRPSRITARVHVGPGRVTDIEREVEARRAAAFQGRHDPVGLSRRALRPGGAARRSRRRSSSSSPTARSKATARPRPSSTRFSRRWPKRRSARISP